MARVPRPSPVEHHLSETPQEIGRDGRASFVWSLAKIRVACLVLLGAAAPAVVVFLVSGASGKWLCLAWLAAVAAFMHCLSRRALAATEVLSIDDHGILDRRLMPRRIAWQEIEGICEVDEDRNHVVDIRLRWPAVTLAQTRWPVRIGAYCQTGYDVPAVSISMLLLEGSAREMLAAVAKHRPDLLHCTNRRAPLGAG
jgi:hypothetical protein